MTPSDDRWSAPEYAVREIAAQVAEVKRELALRERAYPGFVIRASLTAGEADEHYHRLRSALRTLLWVERHADALRATKLDPDKTED